MTLKQLQYVIKGSVTEAAKSLYISQPSLTSATYELEKKYRINIFTRSNKRYEIIRACWEIGLNLPYCIMPLGTVRK